MGKSLIRGAIIGLLGTLVAVTLYILGFLDPLENMTWDLRLRRLADSSRVSKKIVIIQLDQESLNWGEEELALPFPWPRQVLKPIIDFANRGGAKSIAFDVLYTEASAYGVEDDEIFYDGISSTDNFIGALTLNRGELVNWEEEIPSPTLNIEGIEVWLKEREIEPYTTITYPIPELLSGSAMLANVHELPDSDGTFRRGHLFFIHRDRVIPSMALASYMVANIDAKLSIRGNTFTIDGIDIPIDKNGITTLNFKGPKNSFKHIPAAAAIRSEMQILEGSEPQIDPEIFKDAYVFFGYAASGLFDTRPSPVAEDFYGVEIHGTMLDNILTNDFIKPLNLYLSITIVLILAMLSGFTVSRLKKVAYSLGISVILLALPIPLGVLLYFSNVWFPLVFIEVGIFISLLGAGIVNFVTEGKQKRYIKSAFKQYLSPVFIEHLLASPDKLKLGGEKKELTIFFSDLEGFTTISEGLGPEELTALLNEYLTAMTNIIQEEGGTIDKYEGDAIIAFWNAPVTYDDHPIRGVRALLRCQQKLDDMREDIYQKTGHRLKMRIGMNTGYAVVGNLGSDSRFDYSMLGDSVNLAARLEGVNKQFGTYSIVSQATFEKTGDEFAGRELAKVAVVGKKEAVTLYEPMLLEEYTKKSKVYEVFHRGLNNFYKGEFKEAIKYFTAIKDKDPAAAKYIIKCNELQKNTPKEWDGVWVMTTK